LATNEAGSSIGLTASLAERQPLVIDLDSEIVMKRCTMGSALAVVVNPNMTEKCFALKFEILNPKHETNTKSEFSNVQNVTSRKVLSGVSVIWISVIRICFGFTISRAVCDFG
jgi:hypothetical protein